MEVEFYDLGNVDKENLKFAVISSVYQGKWIYVRHKERETWETPGGHWEIGESITNTAKRELFEETGAKKFTIKPICDYSVRDYKLNNSDEKSYGRLFFSDVTEIGALPISEIIEVKLFDGLPENLTYPEIQPLFYQKTFQLGRKITYHSDKKVDYDKLKNLFNLVGWIDKTNDINRLKAMVENSQLVVTAWHGEIMIGFARCTTDYVFNGQINNVVIDPKYRRKGIGRVLLEKILDSSKQVTYMLRASATNEKFYRKLGFEDGPISLIYKREN